ncbi:hypothetical protein [Acetivibrio cellulolyticus]|uniref:hypothetical protein n=1 Tax=Acetivibrio cellulolyticus TaxID=35830 RepID=UPI0001E2BDE9|nr:hypothetical protein [Acetivibrio cellulolyticus]
MGNLKDKLARFMYGRYGMDELSYALFVTYFVLLFANIFIHTKIFSILMFAVVFVMVFRTFSRNIYKRRMENEKFMKIWKPVKSKGSLTVRRIKEIKTRRFRKCPNCKSVLRLPRKTGKHTVNCPCCHNEFELRILW